MDDAIAKLILQKNCFTHSSVADMIFLLQHCGKATYTKNEEIYSPLDPVEYVYAIEKGSVELFNYTAGKLQKKTFTILNKGNIFGYGELAEEHHVIYAVAQSRTEILKIPKSNFLNAICSNKNLSLDFFLSMAHQISQNQRSALVDNARGKVINYLAWICSQFAAENNGVLTVPRVQTNEQISNLLFLTRETVIRTFQSLETEGIISVEKKTILILKPEAIKEEQIMMRQNIVSLK